MLAVLKERRSITDRDNLYHFECPDLATGAIPGQFVEVKVCEGPEPYLRRPISIFSADSTSISLLVRTVGRGTTLMGQWQPQTAVDMLGPLGNGFKWDQNDQNLLLIGGGIGVAPLHFLAERLVAENKRVHMLFSPYRDRQILDSFLVSPSIETFPCENRLEIPLVMERLLNNPIDRIFACGPIGMMKTVVEIGLSRQIPIQVSMEANMACGIGLCIGCAIPIRTERGIEYKKVCHEGPVFAGEQVVFDE